MAPVIVCVVETGIPESVAPTSVIAPEVSAQKPPNGWQLRDLRAHRLHDPPAAEHRAERDRRVADQDDPERDVEASTRCPVATSVPVMMPIVFWASLPPWPRL